jgi:hypothetical protein
MAKGQSGAMVRRTDNALMVGAACDMANKTLQNSCFLLAHGFWDCILLTLWREKR